MEKIVWFVIFLAVVLVLYALWSGLAVDVQHPFTPPPHP